MLQITKIFRFEMAHAIFGYAGSCQHIHGHSYELHVTIAAENDEVIFLPAPGFIIDFKDLKQLVQDEVIKKFDHQLVLSKDYIQDDESLVSRENLLIFDAEPTAENMLIFIKINLQKILPVNLILTRLKLYETRDSYAEWINDSQ